MQTDRQSPTQPARTIFNRVLVPVNFSMASHQAVHVALELQRCCGARVCVFNVAHAGENDEFLATLGSPAERSDLRGEGGSAAVRRFVSHIAPGHEENVECAAKIGDDYVAAIRAKVDEWQASLLVLSQVSRPSLLRSHVEKLTQSVSVPVLLLHAEPHSEEP